MRVDVRVGLFDSDDDEQYEMHRTLSLAARWHGIPATNRRPAQGDEAEIDHDGRRALCTHLQSRGKDFLNERQINDILDWAWGSLHQFKEWSEDEPVLEYESDDPDSMFRCGTGEMLSSIHAEAVGDLEALVTLMEEARNLLLRAKDAAQEVVVWSSGVDVDGSRYRVATTPG